MALAERVEHSEVDEGGLIPEYDLEIGPFLPLDHGFGDAEDREATQEIAEQRADCCVAQRRSVAVLSRAAQ